MCYALAGRIIHSDNLEVKVGGTALLICAAKEHRQRTLAALNESGCFIQLICSLVHMLKQATEINVLRINKVNNVYEGQGRYLKEETHSQWMTEHPFWEEQLPYGCYQ